MPQRRQAGYTIIALMAAIAVSGILMATIAPTWRYLVIRDKEEELIFRGEQYMLAIDRYNAKFNAMPTKLEDLVKNRFLRRLYLDPMTGGPFELIYASGAGNKRASQLPPEQQEQLLNPQPGGSGMGIIGVVSTSPKEAIRPYKDKTHYNEWEFIAGEKKDEGEGKEGEEGEEVEDEGEDEEGDWGEEPGGSFTGATPTISIKLRYSYRYNREIILNRIETDQVCIYSR
jgi:type II secretory pathway pseudopilin PulG